MKCKVKLPMEASKCAFCIDYYVLASKTSPSRHCHESEVPQMHFLDFARLTKASSGAEAEDAEPEARS